MYHFISPAGASIRARAFFSLAFITFFIAYFLSFKGILIYAFLVHKKYNKLSLSNSTEKWRI
jgi:hypothetical protein